MKKTKVVVTGGAGFIGSTLTDSLMEKGYDVHIVDIASCKKENINPKAVFHEVDSRDREKLIPIFRDADCIFHCAAYPSVQYSIEHPIETNDINVNSTINVLMAAKEAGSKKVVYSASAAVYGDQKIFPAVENMLPQPKSPYGLQKYIGEHLCRLWTEIQGVPTVSLRYFNVFGPRQSNVGAYASVIPIFIRQRKNGEEMTITGDGSVTRDFVHVKDIVRANILAMENQNVGKGESINIGGGKEITVLQVAKAIGGPYKFIAPRIEPKRSLADITLAKNLLGWEPKEDFEKGIIELKKLAGIE